MDRNRASVIFLKRGSSYLRGQTYACTYQSQELRHFFSSAPSFSPSPPPSSSPSFLSFSFFFKPAFLLLSSCWYSSQLKESHMILKWRKIYLKWVMGILPIFTFLFLHVVCNITIFTGYRFDIVLFSVLQRNQQGMCVYVTQGKLMLLFNSEGHLPSKLSG